MERVVRFLAWAVVVVCVVVVAFVSFESQRHGRADSVRESPSAVAASPRDTDAPSASSDHDARGTDAAPDPTTHETLADRPAASEAAPARREPENLDHASWPEIERRLTAAIDYARAADDVHVDPELLDRLRDRGSAHLIVGLADPGAAIEPVLEGGWHDAPRDFATLPYTRFEAGPQAVEQLLLSGRITSIEIRRAVGAALEDATVLIDVVTPIAAGDDGTGFTVAVVDSGIELAHPFFGGRIVDGHCFSVDSLCPNGETSQTDDVDAGAPCNVLECAHGTEVAGAVAGDSVQRTGSAPGATLISVMAASIADDNVTAEYTTDDLTAALEKLYQQRAQYSIAAVNLSLGEVFPIDGPPCNGISPAFRAAARQLDDAGIAVVAASGNEGLSGRIAWPACVDSVIAVGATTKSDEVATFTNVSNELDLLAPGTDITTSTTGGGFAAGFAGTSLAAPLVAGAFATIMDAVPEADSDQILVALRTTGEPIRDPESGLLRQRIDVEKSIGYLLGLDLRSDAERFHDELESSLERCGLVGPELLIPLVLARAMRSRRRSRSAALR